MFKRFTSFALVAGLGASSLAAGLSLLSSTPADALVTSPSNTPAQNYVAYLYNDFLNRAADAGGSTYYTNFLGTSNPPATSAMSTVATQILASSEYRQDLVLNDYTTYLHRAGDPIGIAFWTNIGKSTNDTGLAADFLSSGEYWSNRGGSTFNGWLSAVYSDVLGRALDPSGQTFYDAQAAANVPLAKIATEILTSSEADQDVVKADYTNLLRRPADSGGVAYYSAMLQKGATDESILAILASSSEYYAYTQSH